MKTPFRRRVFRLAIPLVAAAMVATGIQVAIGSMDGVAAAAPGHGQGHGDYPRDCPWMNTHLSPAMRARLLLDASTLDQKIRWLDEQAANSPTQTKFGRGNSTTTYPVQVPCTPNITYTDGPDYVRGSDGATVYPSQLALAASWSTSLAYDKGKSQADEAFRAGKNVILGPGMNSLRTPLGGRTPEFLGEDAYLSGTMAAADINGMQKGNRSEPVMSVVKHYVANEQELDRHNSSSDMTGRVLREAYDLPFRIAIGKGEPGGVMCSYNQVNGTYACENPILNNVLKDGDGFAGYVVSDFGAVHTTAPSLNAGLDQELNVPRFYTPENINEAIDKGEVSEAQIDAAAFRVVRAYIAAGLFDHPVPATPSTDLSTPANKKVAQQIAERGSVLLKNSNAVLPLTGKDRTIAIIGPTASNTPTDGISAATVCAEGGSFSRGNPCPNPVAPLDAITARAAQVGANVTFDNGSDVTAAAATAHAADVAIVFGYSKQGEGSDRTTLALDGNGDALISAVTAANPNTVVVLETGTATTMPWLSAAAGVIEAWYPGDQQGTALAKLLYGDVNFTGRLPMTFPKSLADTPTSTDAQYPGLLPDGSTTRADGDDSIRQVSYSEGLAIGHKWYESRGIEPLYPFGFGLSYTTFRYSNLHVSADNAQRHHGHRAPGITVRFTVTNTGGSTGTATAQTYLALPSSADEPGLRLVNYQPVTLRPGQSHWVTVHIDSSSVDEPMSYWSTDTHEWEIANGTYQVTVGGSSQASLHDSVTVRG